MFSMLKKCESQKGIIALLIGMVAMFLASGLALSAVFVFLNRAKAARNIVYSYEAIYASEGGAEDMLLRYFDDTKSLPSSYPSTLSVGNASASSTVVVDAVGDGTIISEGSRQSRIRELRINTSPIGPGGFRNAIEVGPLGINLEANVTVIGDVFSNGNISDNNSNTEIQGDAAAVGTITSPKPVVTGIRTEGSPPSSMPEIDNAFWKAQANINSDPYIGNLTLGPGASSLGPRKVEGDLTIIDNFTMTGVIHVTGNMEMRSNSALYLDDIFAASTTVMIVEGTVTFQSNSEIHATVANPKGYVLILSESTSPTAIEFKSNQIFDAAVYAQNGTLVLRSNTAAVSVAAKYIQIESGSTITYNYGLGGADFTGGTGTESGEGPGGRVISWQEQ